MSNLLLLAFSFTIAALLYRLRAPILAALRRFDAKNRARRREQFEERFDANAHYRHTLALAEEQFEAVQRIMVNDERTGAPVERFLFLGEAFTTREEADVARQEAVAGQARAFYQDLDKVMLERFRRGPGVRGR